MGFKINRLLSATDILYFASVFGQRIFVFAATLILAHALAPQSYDAITLMMTLALMLSALSTAWLTGATYRFAADADLTGRKENIDIIVSTYPWALLIGITILIITNAIWLQMDIVLISAAIFIAITFSFGDILSAALNAQQMPRSYFSISMLRTASTLTIVVISVICGWGLLGAVIAYLIGGAMIFSSFLARKFIVESRLHFPRFPQVWNLARYGVPAGVAFNNYILVYGVARLIMAKANDPGEVGRFILASDLFAAPTTLVLGTFVLSYMPRMNQGWFENGEDGARPWAKKLLFSQLALGIPIVIGGLLIGDVIWHLLGPGPQRSEELWLPAIAAANGACLGWIGTCSTVLLSINRPWSAFFFTVSSILFVSTGAYCSIEFQNITITSIYIFAGLLVNVFSITLFTLFKSKVIFSKLDITILISMGFFSLSLGYLFRKIWFFWNGSYFLQGL